MLETLLVDLPRSLAAFNIPVAHQYMITDQSLPLGLLMLYSAQALTGSTGLTNGYTHTRAFQDSICQDRPRSQIDPLGLYQVRRRPGSLARTFGSTCPLGFECSGLSGLSLFTPRGFLLERRSERIPPYDVVTKGGRSGRENGGILWLASRRSPSLRKWDQRPFRPRRHPMGVSAPPPAGPP